MPRDLLFALRSVLRQPGFFAVAILTLALGIASTTAIFSLFYQVLLRTLPIADPPSLVLLHQEGFDISGGVSKDNFESVYSYPMYLRLRDGLKDWRGLAARSRTGAQLTATNSPVRVGVEIVTGNFFDVLGVRPAHGRLLTQADDSTRGGNAVAVLSHGFFVSNFGASPNVIGTKVVMNGQPFEIIGVAAESFKGILAGQTPEVYVPLSMRATLTPGWNEFDRPTMRWLNVIGRLPENKTRADVQAGLQTLFTTVAKEHVAPLRMPEKARMRAEGARIEALSAASGVNELEQRWKQPLRALFAMVSLLLLIACANLANLLLSRGVNRARELAIRMSMGASRAQIVRLLLSEASIIAVAGVAIGAAGAPLLANAVIRAFSSNGFSGWVSGGLSMSVLFFAIALGVLATLLAGLAPALRLAKSTSINDRSRAGSAGHTRSRKFFIAAQLALSLVLLAVAGLYGRSLTRLVNFRPGFEARELATFTVNPGGAGYDPVRGAVFFRDLRARIQALPGVTSVSLADAGPFQGSSSGTNVEVEGYQHGPDENMDVLVVAAGPAYMRTMGTRLLAGRDLADRDTMDGPRVAVVNEAFVRRFFKQGENIVGRHMSQGSGGPLDIEIVGVAEDVKHLDLREKVEPAFFGSFEHAMKGRPRASRATFYVRSSRSVMDSFRPLVAQLDAQLPVSNIQTMQKALDDSILIDRMVARLSTAFGALALLITAVGLYGVLTYLTTRRTAEFGIRMALGATRANILKLVTKEVLILLAAGGIVGTAGAYAAMKAIESQLFGHAGFDGLVIAAALGVLIVVATIAAAMPSAKAASVQPSQALRHE